MFCPECGSKNQKTSKFCTACGTSLEDTIQTTEVTNQKTNSQFFLIFGWIANVISLLYFPIIFGAFGFIFGYLHRRDEETQGTIMMTAAIAMGVTGMLLGASVGMYW